MKLRHVDQVAVYYEPEPGQRIKVGRLALKSRQLLFQYEAAFLGTKLELSPWTRAAFGVPVPRTTSHFPTDLVESTRC